MGNYTQNVIIAQAEYKRTEIYMSYYPQMKRFWCEKVVIKWKNVLIFNFFTGVCSSHRVPIDKS